MYFCKCMETTLRVPYSSFFQLGDETEMKKVENDMVRSANRSTLAHTTKRQGEKENFKPPKKPRKDSLADALTGAAVAFAQSFQCGSKGKDDSPKRSSSLPITTGVSPGRSIELRMKNLEQLRYLQQLFEDRVVSEQEFSELKGGILSSLRNL